MQRKYNMLAAFSIVQMLEIIGLKSDEDHELKKLLDQARESLQDGRKGEASELYEIALKLAISRKDAEHIHFIKEKMAAIAFASKQLSDAEKLYSEVKKYLLAKKAFQDNMRLLNVNMRLAEIYNNLKDYSKAEQLYQETADYAKPQLNNIENQDDEFIEFWLQFLTSEAHYFLQRGNIDTAHKFFTKAYNQCVKTKGEMHEHSVTLLQQLGAVCFQKGDLEDAVNYLSKAIELGKHLPGMIELSNAYISLGNILLVQGLVKAAEAACHQGLKNAQRHKYIQGIREAEACLKEAMEAATTS